MSRLQSFDVSFNSILILVPHPLKSTMYIYILASDSLSSFSTLYAFLRTNYRLLPHVTAVLLTRVHFLHVLHANYSYTTYRNQISHVSNNVIIIIIIIMMICSLRNDDSHAFFVNVSCERNAEHKS